eukprot:TRINITY_DN64796_c0_g1_i3.p1 TRINITY_DN64796_c0_g1~~TRINITY_DN64796_c0_g1_i3.p1  ORF type:complete len:799 (+),score=60.72 TRINITY_DN64796_c0_g1_i3:85-2397(+)
MNSFSRGENIGLMKWEDLPAAIRKEFAASGRPGHQLTDRLAELIPWHEEAVQDKDKYRYMQAGYNTCTKEIDYSQVTVDLVVKEAERVLNERALLPDTNRLSLKAKPIVLFGSRRTILRKLSGQLLCRLHGTGRQNSLLYGGRGTGKTVFNEAVCQTFQLLFPEDVVTFMWDCSLANYNLDGISRFAAHAHREELDGCSTLDIWGSKRKVLLFCLDELNALYKPRTGDNAEMLRSWESRGKHPQMMFSFTGTVFLPALFSMPQQIQDENNEYPYNQYSPLNGTSIAHHVHNHPSNAEQYQQLFPKLDEKGARWLHARCGGNLSVATNILQETEGTTGFAETQPTTASNFKKGFNKIAQILSAGPAMGMNQYGAQKYWEEIADPFEAPELSLDNMSAILATNVKAYQALTATAAGDVLYFTCDEGGGNERVGLRCLYNAHHYCTEETPIANINDFTSLLTEGFNAQEQGSKRLLIGLGAGVSMHACATSISLYTFLNKLINYAERHGEDATEFRGYLQANKMLTAAGVRDKMADADVQDALGEIFSSNALKEEGLYKLLATAFDHPDCGIFTDNFDTSFASYYAKTRGKTLQDLVSCDPNQLYGDSKKIVHRHGAAGFSPASDFVISRADYNRKQGRPISAQWSGILSLQPVLWLGFGTGIRDNETTQQLAQSPNPYKHFQITEKYCPSLPNVCVKHFPTSGDSTDYSVLREWTANALCAVGIVSETQSSADEARQESAAVGRQQCKQKGEDDPPAAASDVSGEQQQHEGK